ncbi:unnamed protein product [Camellia sinensis]
MHEVVTSPTQLPPPHSSSVCSVGVDTCRSHISTLHTPTFVGISSTTTTTTHDAVLTDISHAQDEVYIEGLPRARGRDRGYGRGGRRSRGRGAGRGRCRGPAADRDTVAPDEGVSQLTAVSNVGPEGGSEAAQAGESRSQSQAPQVVAGGPHVGEGAPQDLHLRLESHIFRESMVGDRGRRSTVEVVGLGAS